MSKNFIILLTLLVSSLSCGNKDGSSTNKKQTETSRDPLKEVYLATPSGQLIDATIAYKIVDQQRGLSGIPSSDFKQDDGKLFFYFNEASRTFWMPNMHFNLDIFYLDSMMQIIEVVRDLPFERTSHGRIPRAPAIYSRHVLEMRADSSTADKLEIGDRLEWKSSLTIEETENKMKETRP